MEPKPAFEGSRHAMGVATGLLGALTALFFLYPTPLLSSAEAAVKSLTGG